MKLESLGFELQYIKKHYYPKKVLFTICWLIPVVLSVLYFLEIPDIALEGVATFYFIAIVMSVVYSTDHYQDDIYLAGGKSVLAFYRERPGEKEVLDFIGEVIIATKAFLKSKYTDFDDATTPQEFYNCLHWLYEREVITRDEYIDYKASFDLQKLL